jgi:hypothetical protein
MRPRSDERVIRNKGVVAPVASRQHRGRDGNAIRSELSLRASSPEGARPASRAHEQAAAQAYGSAAGQHTHLFITLLRAHIGWSSSQPREPEVPLAGGLMRVSGS